MNEIIHCPSCKKETSYCICSDIKQIDNSVYVTVLQHPQEVKEPLNSGVLTHLSLKQSQIKVGFSWGNLKKVAPPNLSIPKSWAVLYLGAKSEYPKMRGKFEDQIYIANAKEKLRESTPEDLGQIKGIIAIDANWKQAKTIWWRNSWFLKLPRIVLVTRTPSKYGSVRREPRKECLSTIESVSKCLDIIEEKRTYYGEMSQTLEKLIDVYKGVKNESSSPS